MSPGPNWLPLRYVRTGDLTVAVNDIDPNRDIFRYPPAERLTHGQFEQLSATFHGAWDILKQYYPHAADTIGVTLNTIVPAPPGPRTRGKSMAAGAGLGVVGVNEYDDPMRLATQVLFST